MVKKHIISQTGFSKEIGLLCRLILFLEDVVEDSQCEDIYVENKGFDGFVLKPFNCIYSVNDSMSLFRDRYNIDKISLGDANTSYKTLYDRVIEVYVENLHPKIKRLSKKTHHSGVEFFAGVTFDGKFFLLEGEKGLVKIPVFPHCLSIHTHPSLHPIPSREDFKSIAKLLIDRGIGHVITAGLSSIAIYRVKPLTVDDYEALREWLLLDPLETLDIIKEKSDFIKIRVLP